MGLWGAAQATAFGLGGFLGTVGVDLVRHLAPSPGTAYAIVFVGESVLFLVAAALANNIRRVGEAPSTRAATGSRDAVAAGV